MQLDLVRLTEHAHGHLGWLATAALVHPAVVLRHRARRAHLAVSLAALFVTVSAAFGVWLYTPYRQQLRQSIFASAPSTGFLFERKEHLAFGVVMLAWVGTAAYFAAARATPIAADRLRVVAFRAFCASAALSLFVAVLGTVVAVTKTF